MFYFYSVIVVAIVFGLLAHIHLHNRFIVGLAGGCLYFIILPLVRIFLEPYYGMAITWGGYYREIFANIFLSFIISYAVYSFTAMILARLASQRSIKNIQKAR